MKTVVGILYGKQKAFINNNNRFPHYTTLSICCKLLNKYLFYKGNEKDKTLIFHYLKTMFVEK